MGILQKAVFLRKIQMMEEHYHDCHQIVFITKGVAEFHIGQATETVSAASVLLFNRFESHSLCVLSEEYERYVLYIDPTVFHFEESVFSLLFNRPKGFRNVIDVSEDAAQFHMLFERLLFEYEHTERLNDDMQKLLLQELLVLIYRKYPEAFCFDPLVYSIQRQFEQNCRKNHSLQTLSREHAISISSLSHRFKRFTGSAVMDYLLHCRIALAKNLLANSNLEVGQIVEACGFSDSSNFSRTFKRLNGCTPSEFRKKYKEE